MNIRKTRISYLDRGRENSILKVRLVVFEIISCINLQSAKFIN